MADGCSSLTIADDEYTSKATEYDGKITSIDEAFQQYLSILRAILDDKLIEGKKLEKISGFADFVQQYLSGKLINIASEQTANMNTYISEINAADSVLY